MCNVFCIIHHGMGIFGLILFLLASSSNIEANSRSNLQCEISIVGGGVGGLHTAYRLANSLGSRVCLFEKEPILGGRIKDVSIDPKSPAEPVIGVGAMRIMENQSLMLRLAKELGVSLEASLYGSHLIKIHGHSAFDEEDFVRFYPGMPMKRIHDIGQEAWLYERLLKGPERVHVEKYPNLQSYAQAVIGNKGLAYLRDTSIFKSDFDYPLDARAYLDYLDEEWELCCKEIYPVGGMSAFIQAMEARSSSKGVRIFKNEPISDIIRVNDREYLLKSAHYVIQSQRLILALPPHALKFIKGDVVDRIKAQKHFQEIVGVKVLTITQWWSQPWWKNLRNPDVTGGRGQIWRAWTSDNCINYFEIPSNPYAARQNVTRSVYTDNGPCIKRWEKMAIRSPAQLERKIKSELERLFSYDHTHSLGFEIPQALKTYVQVWPAAWHYLRAGASHSNTEIAEWALHPLPREPIALVGEAYYLRRSGWSEAAFKSSLKLLRSQYTDTVVLSGPGMR